MRLALFEPDIPQKAGTMLRLAACFGVPFEEAVRMATATPAALLKVKKGKIEEGFDADLLVIGDNGEIERVMIGGEWFS